MHERAANLRRAFSGIVAGNIKEYGINAIERYGPFELRGEPSIMEPLDRLLRSFVAQRRMKFTGRGIHPLLQTRGMNEPLRIRYRFDLPDGSQKTLDFTFDPTTFGSQPRARGSAVLDRAQIQPLRQLSAQRARPPALPGGPADGLGA